MLLAREWPIQDHSLNTFVNNESMRVANVFVNQTSNITAAEFVRVGWDMSKFTPSDLRNRLKISYFDRANTVEIPRSV